MTKCGTYFRVRQWMQRAESPIGCMIDADSVTVAQLRAHDRRVIGAVEPVASDRGRGKHHLVRAIRNACASAPFQGRDVVLCFPHHAVNYRRLLVPPLDKDCTADEVHLRMAEDLGCEPTDICTDYHEVGDFDDGRRRMREVIAISASASDVHATVAAIKEAGLRPQAIDSACGAIARCLMPASRDEPLCLIDLCTDRPVVIVARHGTPRLVYTVPEEEVVPSPPMATSGAASIEYLSRAEQLVSVLAQEINICAHYLNERSSGETHVRCGCIIGAGGWEQRLAEMLSEASVVEFRCLTQIVNTEQCLMLEQLAALGRPHGWAAPLGLAMYEHFPVHPESAT